ncbi:MAG: hypothetical protein K9M45_06895 [Kiritimatiellales bacterium]|nr:hypothetical protein [Kiritimatiellales bacterium]
MSKRRKQKSSVTLLAENVEFIREVLLPSRPELKGHFARGVQYCVDTWLGVLKGNIPEIPRRGEDCDIQLERESITLTPGSVTALDAIVQYWRNAGQTCNRSAIADHFITLSRQRHEQLDEL